MEKVLKSPHLHAVSLSDIFEDEKDEGEEGVKEWKPKGVLDLYVVCWSCCNKTPQTGNVPN